MTDPPAGCGSSMGRPPRQSIEKSRPEPVEVESRREHHRGGVCITEHDGIHLIENLQKKQDLITLHVYSPPLCMTYYELASDMQS